MNQMANVGFFFSNLSSTTTTRVFWKKNTENKSHKERQKFQLVFFLQWKWKWNGEKKRENWQTFQLNAFCRYTSLQFADAIVNVPRHCSFCIVLSTFCFLFLFIFFSCSRNPKRLNCSLSIASSSIAACRWI